MHKQITFRNMDSSKVMKQYAEDQLAKIEEFLEHERSPIYIELVLEPSTIHQHHRAELRVKSPNYNLISNYEREGVGFYDVLDRVIDVMYNRLHEEKRKRVDGRKGPSISEV